MKKLLVAALSLLCVATLTVNAQETKKKHELTDEQKAVQKEMLGKYDTDKNGKLDKDEKAKMTQEDKDKYAKAFPHHKKKDAASTDSK